MTFKEAVESGAIPEPVSWYNYQTGEGNDEGQKRAQQYIAKGVCTPEGFFVGDISDVKVWDEVLTDEQIKLLSTLE